MADSRGEENAGEDERDACEVVERRLLAEKQHRQERAEGRHEVHELAGAIAADFRHGAVPEDEAECRGKMPA